MEIEAKFSIPDSLTALRFGEISELAGFQLSQGRRLILSDTYMDTANRALFKSGLSCRIRKKNEDLFLTVKSLEDADGAVHRRREYEVPLSDGGDPRNVGRWPGGEPRNLVSRIIGGSALHELFVIHQVRLQRFLRKNDRSIAEMDIDHVIVSTGQHEHEYHELEIELDAGGTEGDLGIIAEELVNTWSLKPENTSKFQRGLSLLDDSSHTGSLLSDEERRFLETVKTRDDLYGRRARAILALHGGASQQEAGERSGMSERRVRHWLAEFRKIRLSIFPKRLRSGISRKKSTGVNGGKRRSGAGESRRSAETKGQQDISARVPERGKDQLLYQNTKAIFEILSPFHGLKSAELKPLEAGALIRAYDQKDTPEKVSETGSSSMPAIRISGLDEENRVIVPLMLNLIKGKISSKRMERIERKYLTHLPETKQREALILASILRMSAACSSSRVSPDAASSESTPDTATIILTGPESMKESGTAETRADLWRMVTGVPVKFMGTSLSMGTEETKHISDVSSKKQTDSPGIEPTDSMAEAARKTLLFHYRRMIHHEPGTREGSDIEELHDMRVATRRMRAAIQTFEADLDSKKIARFLKDLKRTGRALGAVRDLDVFWERAGDYLSDLSGNRRNELDALKTLWVREREEARTGMINYLDGERYTRFKESFSMVLETENSLMPSVDAEDGSTLPRIVSHTVPVILYDRLAAVLAYDGWITRPDTSLELFHELRISAKKLRYALEFCREVLAPESKNLIKEMKGLQDHLGDMQDAVVASSVLRNYLVWGTWSTPYKKKHVAETPRSPVVAPGAAMYLAHMQQLMQDRIETFDTIWDRIRNPRFTQRLAGILVPLRQTE